MTRDDKSGKVTSDAHNQDIQHDQAHQGAILVVDDHELMRRSVAHVLHQEFKSRVVEAGHFDEALELITDPDVYLAIVDLTMPGMTSPHDLAKLRNLRPDVRIVVLSGSEARSDIIASLNAGVHGYIVKSAPTHAVISRIKYVLGGEIYVPPSLADLPASAIESIGVIEELDSQLEVLTPRQREVLQLIAEGMSNKEIGRHLGVAEGTVKMHVATILKSVGANNRAHAAAIGRKFVVAAI